MYGPSCLVASTFRALLSGAIHNGLVDNQAPKSTSTNKFATPNAWCQPAMRTTTNKIKATPVRRTAEVPMTHALSIIPAHLNVVMAGCHLARAGGLYVDTPHICFRRHASEI